jgi:hypothetical protein
LIFACAAFGLIATGCEEKRIMPGNNDNNQDSIYVAPPMPDPADAQIPEGAISVSEALDICRALEPGSASSEAYIVKGWICSANLADNTKAVESYGNVYFYMGVSSESSNKNALYAYQVMGMNGKKVVDANAVAKGDFVVIQCHLTNYNGVLETTGRGDAFFLYSSNPLMDQKEDPTKITPDPEGANIPEGCLNVYQAREICAGLASGAQTAESYFVKGWIHKVASTASDVEQYGNGTFYIAATNDGSTNMFDFEAYRIKGLNGGRFSSLDQMKVGDFVVIEGKLKNYSGTYETGDGAKLYYSNNPNVQ